MCLLLGTVVLPFVAHALDASLWKTRQDVTVDRAGIVKLALGPQTLDAAQPALQDLRLIDASGRETPFLIERATATPPATSLPAKSFQAFLDGTTTRLLVETGTSAPLEAIVLRTPAPAFLKAARVETSNDGQQWTLLRDGAPVFRQFGAEQLTLDLARTTATHVRITLADDRSRPVPFTGATLVPQGRAEPPVTVALPGARISHRDEFAGETVLTIDLGARHVPVASLAFSTSDAVFTRRVSMATRELRDEVAVERTLAAGSIYRLAIDGAPTSAQLAIATAFTAPARELIVHIDNGDSPPLAIDGIEIRQQPVWLVFAPNAPGAYTLLTGNPAAMPPRYDLSGFTRQLTRMAPSTLTVGALEPNPAYHASNPLAQTPLVGAPIDPSAWRHQRTVRLAAGGVQQLELDPDVLSGSRSDGGDLRLVRDGRQVPYVVERPTLSRPLRLAITPDVSDGAARVSRWRLMLPGAGVPITRVTLASSTALFQRRLRLLEAVADDRTGSYERVVAEAEWNRVPGSGDSLTFPLELRPVANALILQMDNGDNPAITLTKAEVAYPVVRLLFKADAGPLVLYYGNPDARAPRYDITLVADQLIGAERVVATLDAAPLAASGWSGVGSLRAGVLFWGSLGVVVIALLFVIAKLLPRQS